MKITLPTDQAIELAGQVFKWHCAATRQSRPDYSALAQKRCVRHHFWKSSTAGPKSEIGMGLGKLDQQYFSTNEYFPLAFLADSTLENLIFLRGKYLVNRYLRRDNWDTIDVKQKSERLLVKRVTNVVV